jgi:hypothetical protein
MKSPAAALCIFIICLILLLDDICLIMIDSARLESNTDQHLQKFDDINNNHYQTENPLLDCENPMKETILSSTNQENDTNLLTTTTTTTVELKVKTSKTSSARKRKLNLINQINNDNHINKQAAITKKKVI